MLIPMVWVVTVKILTINTLVNITWLFMLLNFMFILNQITNMNMPIASLWKQLSPKNH